MSWRWCLFCLSPRQYADATQRLDKTGVLHRSHDRLDSHSPYLIVLQIPLADALQPIQLTLDPVLRRDVFLLPQHLEYLCPVEPDGIVRWIHADDVLGQIQRPPAELVGSHDRPQVRHGLGITWRVRNGRKSRAWIGLARRAINQRQWRDILPQG